MWSRRKRIAIYRGFGSLVFEFLLGVSVVMCDCGVCWSGLVCMIEVEKDMEGTQERFKFAVPVQFTMLTPSYEST